MRHILLHVCCCLLIPFLTVSTAESSDHLLIAQNGKSLCPIVVSENATPVELTAARELQQHLDLVTGGTFPILKESDVPDNAAQILVGASERVRKLLPDVAPEDFAYDEILIKTLPNQLILTGHKQRGSLYAVNTFLEDVIGVRWWTSKESDVPNNPTLAIAQLDIRYAPKLIYRESFYLDAFDGLFATRMKCNGSAERIPSEYGDHHKFVYFVHSFYPLLAPDKYFEQHPEWYSEIDGKRTHDHAQLCLTNEEMKKELIQNAKAAIRKNPDAGFISISQNDWYGHCQCEKCKAIDEAEGSPSGLMLRFVNDVAEEIEKDFPEMWVETLAYQYTRKPPKITKPRHNVIVRLCSIECSFVQPLTGEQNKSFHDDIVGWNHIAPQLFIWDYVTSFSNYLIPQPNMRVLAPNIRFFVDHGTIGLFEQGDYHCNIGDFVGVRNYVISHLLWDPNLDELKLFYEFMNGYYHEAASHLVEYLKLIHDTAERSGLHIGCFRSDTSAWLDLETLNKATNLFEQALDAVEDDPVAWERVRKAKMTLDHVWLIQYNDFRLQAKLDGKPFRGPTDGQAACKEFFDLCRKWKTTAYREWNHSMDDYEQKLMGQLAPQKNAAPPEQCKNLPENQWIDIQESHLLAGGDRNRVKIVDDPVASNGKTLWMSGDHNEWFAQFHLASRVFDAETRWRVYAMVRCEASVDDGTAMQIGIYDPADKTGVIHVNVPVSGSKGSDYKPVDLGVFPLVKGMYIWVAPPKRPGEVDAIFIDRVFLVKEN